jgi:hypothetical protein
MEGMRTALDASIQDAQPFEHLEDVGDSQIRKCKIGLLLLLRPLHQSLVPSPRLVPIALSQDTIQIIPSVKRLYKPTLALNYKANV